MVALREYAPTDAAWLDTWLATVANVVGYEVANGALLEERLGASKRLRARIITRFDTAVGLIVYSVSVPNRASACFELVATPGDQARKGSGMTAAVLIERELLEAGVQTAYAPAPAMHGISMYFWIRLGYAPLLRPGWPCERDGVAWLRRSLAAAR